MKYIILFLVTFNIYSATFQERLDAVKLKINRNNITRYQNFYQYCGWDHHKAKNKIEKIVDNENESLMSLVEICANKFEASLINSEEKISSKEAMKKAIDNFDTSSINDIDLTTQAGRNQLKLIVKNIIKAIKRGY